MVEKYRKGQRVEFLQDWEVFPHFNVDKGEKGTVDVVQTDLISIKLDKEKDGAETWDNCVHFYKDEDEKNFDYVSKILEILW